MSFVGLHIHTDYSLLDGASQMQKLVERAVELEMPAIAVTDHGVMYGAIDIIKVCRGKGIKPIIGNEMYVINETLDTTKKKIRKYHQVVLAKNTIGYKNLVKLTTKSHLKGMHGSGIFARPCVNKELLREYSEGLIVTSACLGGEVPQAILQNRPDKAREVAQEYKEIFADDYYLEIQDHGSPEDRVVNVELVKIGRELGIKIVATNDSHFISCYDVEAHDALICINTQKQILEEKRMRYSGTEYMKSAEEMAQLFQDHLPDSVIQEAIANTLEVADKVEPYNILGEPRIPDFPVPRDHTPDTYVEEIAWQGLLERRKLKYRTEVSTEYKERLEYELKMIERMGFSTYFLVVWDYIKYARDNGIPVGPGRGSAAGSLVAFVMGITNIDPVHHGLMFERFLNPERKSMPDIDTDFCIEGRDKIIEYVSKRYGEERVAQIITFNRMTSKAVLKDVARVLGIPYGKADQMAKLIPVARGKPAKLSAMISEKTPEPDFKKAYESETVEISDRDGNPIGTIPIRQWVDMAIRIEGTNKTFGVHAAGVVISAEPLDEIVPLQRNNDGATITQYSMENLESLGLLKMDFLGLKNLTIIQKAVNYIQEQHHLTIDPYELPADERKALDILAKGKIKKMPKDVDKTYKLLAKGDLEGVFQLESSGMRQIVRDLKPSSIEDISSILALDRPGPVDDGLIPKFIDRKHGREPIEYDHPLLEPILKETYGILCLPEGTLINKPDGNSVEIEDVKAGDIILTSDGKRVWPAKVANKWHSGVRDIVKISLSSGTIIYASNHHRFLTPDGDVRAAALQPVTGSLKNAHIHSSVLYEQWPVSKNSKKLRPNEAYLLGMLIGDGNLVSSSPNIACSQEITAKWVANLIAETWGGEPKYYFKTRCWYAYCKFNTQPKRTPLTKFMDGLYGGRWWKVKSHEKHLPPDVLDYCEADRIELLRGLWDSDGCYRERLAYYRSVSPQLIKQVGLLLGSLKISYSVGADYILVGDRTRFKTKLGPPKLPEKPQQEITDNYLAIPTGNLLEELEQELVAADRITRYRTKKALERSSFIRPFSAKQSTYKANLDSWDDAYQKIYHQTYLQDARPVYVVDVEECGIAECFDIEMEDQSSPYFLAERLVVHNCFQESVMRIAQDLSGYSLAQADLLRRAMGKKKVAEMQKQRVNFIDGACKNGVKRQIAEKLFEQMLQFAEYCFNKSHSMAYAYVTYQTAYLKANYPAEYMAALLSANSGDQDKVAKYIGYCASNNIKVEQPDINRSKLDFTPVGNTILFGLSAVKNVGEGAIESILAVREKDGAFKSLADLCDRVDLQKVHGRTIEALIKCGALDRINPNRQQLIKHLELTIKWAGDRAKEQASGQLNLFDMAAGSKKTPVFESAPIAPQVQEFSIQEKLQLEKELLGFYVSNHPLKNADLIAQRRDIELMSLGKLQEQRSRSKISAIVIFTEVRKIITKKGEPMAFVQIEDLEGKGEAVVFSSNYAEIKSCLEKTDVPILIEGKVEKREDKNQIVINYAEEIKLEELNAIEETMQPQALPQALDEGEIKQLEAARLVAEYVGLAPVRLRELSELTGKSPVWTIAILAEVQQQLAENGDRVVVLQLVDEDSRAEAIALANTYQKIGSSLVKQVPLLLWGEVSRRNEQAKLIVRDSVWIEAGRLAILELTPEQVNDGKQLQRLQMMLKEYSGDKSKPKVPVMAIVSRKQRRQAVRLGQEFWVQDCEGALDRLRSAEFSVRPFSF